MKRPDKTLLDISTKGLDGKGAISRDGVFIVASDELPKLNRSTKAQKIKEYLSTQQQRHFSRRDLYADFADTCKQVSIGAFLICFPFNFAPIWVALFIVSTIAMCVSRCLARRHQRAADYLQDLIAPTTTTPDNPKVQ